MKQQDSHPADLVVEGWVPDRSHAPHTGPVGSQEFEKAAPLPKPRLRARVTPRLPQSSLVAPPRERLIALVVALGDSQHPDHPGAVEALLEIGGPAIPFLAEALNSRQTWLTAYRAAEALGYLGDSRATGPLIKALRHPNSNVRWSVVRALAQIGDFRAILQLRKVAQEDRGRTSWGESVSDAAQSSLDQLQDRSVWRQSLELLKTTFSSILLVLALILAFSVLTTLKDEFQRTGQLLPNQSSGVKETMAQDLAPSVPEPDSTAPTPAPQPTPTLPPKPKPPASPPLITGKTLQSANVRSAPSVQNKAIGSLSQGDEIIFVGKNASSVWYLVKLGANHKDSSIINNPDGSGAGWVHRELLSQPNGDVPVR